MSVIDEALKKTQSSLKQTQSFTQESPVFEKEKPAFIPPSFAQLISPRRAFKLNYQHIAFGVGGFLLLGALIFSGIHFDKKIHEYAHASAEKILSSPAQTQLTLNGTMRVNQERVAMINQHMYHVGDVVSGFQIKSIHDNQVVLSNQKNHKTIALAQSLSP